MSDVLEIAMLTATFIYSYLILYCKKSAFVFGIIASGIMGFTMIKSGVYVQAILHYLYVLVYAYSFFSWSKSKKPREISHMTKQLVVIVLIYVVTFTVVMGYVFSKFGTVYPYIDAFSAACSMTAVILLSRKVIEHSYIFIASNIASIFICYAMGDYMTILSFVVYMIFNATRVYTWENIIRRKK